MRDNGGFTSSAKLVNRPVMQTAVLIVAAGSGTRLGGPVPKQYQLLNGDMVLTRTLRAVLASSHVTSAICVISGDARELYDEAVGAVQDPRLLQPALGGATRAGSVMNGLEALADTTPDRVLIHDAARPFLAPEHLDALCTTGRLQSWRSPLSMRFGARSKVRQTFPYPARVFGVRRPRRHFRLPGYWRPTGPMPTIPILRRTMQRPIGEPVIRCA